jgi:hypothetical protein
MRQGRRSSEQPLLLAADADRVDGVGVVTAHGGARGTARPCRHTPRTRSTWLARQQREGARGSARPSLAAPWSLSPSPGRAARPIQCDPEPIGVSLALHAVDAVVDHDVRRLARHKSGSPGRPIGSGTTHAVGPSRVMAATSSPTSPRFAPLRDTARRHAKTAPAVHLAPRLPPRSTRSSVRSQRVGEVAFEAARQPRLLAHVVKHAPHHGPTPTSFHLRHLIEACRSTPCGGYAGAA